MNDDELRAEVEKLREKLLIMGPLPLGGDFRDRPDQCPEGPHRGPQGPCEDLSQCGRCWMPSFALRPAGETFGEHADDCSLPAVHEGWCVGGGSGHPPSRLVRGFWPPS